MSKDAITYSEPVMTAYPVAIDPHMKLLTEIQEVGKIAQTPDKTLVLAAWLIALHTVQMPQSVQMIEQLAGAMVPVAQQFIKHLQLKPGTFAVIFPAKVGDDFGGFMAKGPVGVQ